MYQNPQEYQLFKKTLEGMTEKELQVVMVLYLKDIKDLLLPVSTESEGHLQAKSVAKKYV